MFDICSGSLFPRMSYGHRRSYFINLEHCSLCNVCVGQAKSKERRAESARETAPDHGGAVWLFGSARRHVPDAPQNAQKQIPHPRPNFLRSPLLAGV